MILPIDKHPGGGGIGSGRFRAIHCADSEAAMRAKVVALAAAIGFAGILALNFALIRQNRHLKAELAAPPALLPKIGTRIDQLAGVALDGSQARVLFDGQARRTLLFVFSTRCAVCNLNWPQWQAITRSVPSQNFRLVYANIQSPIT